MSATDKLNPRSCSLAEAERWLGVSRQTLAKWIDRGAPVVQRPEGKGKPALVSVPDLWQWKMEQEIQAAIAKACADHEGDPNDPERMSKEEADRRFAVARALREEGRAMDQYAQVIPVADVSGAVARRLSVMRQILMGLYREAPELLLRKTGMPVQTTTPVLRSIVDKVLQELNKPLDFRAPENETIETDDETEAPTKSD